MPFDAEITEQSADLIVLEKARARIARGWVQGECEALDGRVCIGGAYILLGFAETGRWPGWGTEGHQAYAEALGFSGTPEMVAWNDAPGRTKAEVLARFDAAIERLSADA